VLYALAHIAARIFSMAPVKTPWAGHCYDIDHHGRGVCGRRAGKTFRPGCRDNGIKVD
jgi:hypothetical protein